MINTIVVGLFDKDQKKQLIQTEKAIAEIARTILSEFAGATLSECSGIYTHNNGEVIVEKSIKIELAWVEWDDVSKAEFDKNCITICKILKKDFNQESVLFCNGTEQTKFI